MSKPPTKPRKRRATPMGAYATGPGWVVVPLRLVGSQNAREHWRARTRRVKHERYMATVAVRTMPPVASSAPYVVELTRVGPRKVDGDNLQGSLKAVRDGVADALGVDDGDEDLVVWTYRQELGPYACRIRLVCPCETNQVRWECASWCERDQKGAA